MSYYIEYNSKLNISIKVIILLLFLNMDYIVLAYWIMGNGLKKIKV